MITSRFFPVISDWLQEDMWRHRGVVDLMIFIKKNISNSNISNISI